MVKNLPTNVGHAVRSLGLDRGEPLEKEMATHSSILAWEIPRTEKFGGLHSPWSYKRVRHNLAAKTTTCTYQHFVDYFQVVLVVFCSFFIFCSLPL